MSAASRHVSNKDLCWLFHETETHNKTGGNDESHMLQIIYLFGSFPLSCNLPSCWPLIPSSLARRWALALKHLVDGPLHIDHHHSSPKPKEHRWGLKLGYGLLHTQSGRLALRKLECVWVPPWTKYLLPQACHLHQHAGWESPVALDFPSLNHTLHHQDRVDSCEGKDYGCVHKTPHRCHLLSQTQRSPTWWVR